MRNFYFFLALASLIVMSVAYGDGKNILVIVSIISFFTFIVVSIIKEWKRKPVDPNLKLLIKEAKKTGNWNELSGNPKFSDFLETGDKETVLSVAEKSANSPIKKKVLLRKDITKFDRCRLKLFDSFFCRCDLGDY